MLKLGLELSFAHFQCAHPQLSWGSCRPSTALQNKESLCYPCPSSRPAYCLPFKGSTWTALFYSLQHLSWVMPGPVIPMHFVVRESPSKPCGCYASPAYDGFSGQNTRMGKRIEIGLEPSVLGWSQDAQGKVPWTGEASPLWRFLHRLVCVRVYMLSHVQLFATPWTVALQAPLSVGFSRKEYWRKLPFPSLGGLPRPSDQTSVSCISCIGRWILYS